MQKIMIIPILFLSIFLSQESWEFITSNTDYSVLTFNDVMGEFFWIVIEKDNSIDSNEFEYEYLDIRIHYSEMRVDSFVSISKYIPLPHPLYSNNKHKCIPMFRDNQPGGSWSIGRWPAWQDTR